MFSIDGEKGSEGLRTLKTLPRRKRADVDFVTDLGLGQIASKTVVIFPPLLRLSSLLTA